MAPKAIPVDWDALCAHLEARGTLSDWCRSVGLRPDTVQKKLSGDPALRARVDAARQGVGAALARGTSDASGPPSVDASNLRELKLGEIATLADENGIDLNEWTIDRATVNKWGVPGEESRQVKVQMRPRTVVDKLGPGVPPIKTKTGRKVKPRKGEPTIVVALGDHHAPYHEPGMHAASLKLIEDLQPHRVVHTGDGPDYPTLGDHPPNPALAADPQDCCDAFVGILRDLADASPHSERDYIPGNHCLRPRNYVLRRAPKIHGLAPGLDDERLAAMDPRRLYRLDEIGFRYIAPPDDGEYYDGQLLIGNTMFTHGFLAGRGASHRQAQKFGRDVVHGHDHKAQVERVSITFKGEKYTFTACATGTMAGQFGHNRYLPRGTADEHQAFAVATIWPDGEATYEHARWDGDALRYRSDRYAA